MLISVDFYAARAHSVIDITVLCIKKKKLKKTLHNLRANKSTVTWIIYPDIVVSEILFASLHKNSVIIA